MCHCFTFQPLPLLAPLPSRSTVQSTAQRQPEHCDISIREQLTETTLNQRLDCETVFNSKAGDSWSSLHRYLCSIALHPDKVREQPPPWANVYFHSDDISIHSPMESFFQRKPQLDCIKCVKTLILSVKQGTRLQLRFLAKPPDWFFSPFFISSRLCFGLVSS